MAETDKIYELGWEQGFLGRFQCGLHPASSHMLHMYTRGSSRVLNESRYSRLNDLKVCTLEGL